MKGFRSPRRGVAAEVVILAVVLIGGAGWFGVKEIKHTVEEYKQEQKVKAAEIEAAKAAGISQGALTEREKAEAARIAAEEARGKVKEKEMELGRTIQRSSVQASLAIQQLPDSVERDFLANSMREIDSASEGLFGLPKSTEVDFWRQTALGALAGEAVAKAQVAKQMREIEGLRGQLSEARTYSQQKETEATAANRRANAEQLKAHDAVKRTSAATKEAAALFADNNTVKGILQGLAMILLAIAGIWVLGLLLKIFSIGVEPDGTAARLMGTAANTLHSLMAPMAVLGETHAQRQTDKLVDSNGNFITEVRDKLPKEMQEKITEMLDVALSPTFQQKICKAHRRIRQQRAAQAAG